MTVQYTWHCTHCATCDLQEEDITLPFRSFLLPFLHTTLSVRQLGFPMLTTTYIQRNIFGNCHNKNRTEGHLILLKGLITYILKLLTGLVSLQSLNTRRGVPQEGFRIVAQSLVDPHLPVSCYAHCQLFSSHLLSVTRTASFSLLICSLLRALPAFLSSLLHLM
jgi:hypothetical protein